MEQTTNLNLNASAYQLTQDGRAIEPNAPLNSKPSHIFNQFAVPSVRENADPSCGQLPTFSELPTDRDKEAFKRNYKNFSAACVDGVTEVLKNNSTVSDTNKISEIFLDESLEKLYWGESNLSKQFKESLIRDWKTNFNKNVNTDNMSDGMHLLDEFIELKEYLSTYSPEKAKEIHIEFFYKTLNKNLKDVRLSIENEKWPTVDKSERLELIDKFIDELDRTRIVNYEYFFIFSMRLAFLSTPESLRKLRWLYKKEILSLEKTKAWMSHELMKEYLSTHPLINLEDAPVELNKIIESFPARILIPTTTKCGISAFNAFTRMGIYPIYQHSDSRGMIADCAYHTNVMYFYQNLQLSYVFFKIMDKIGSQFHDFESIQKKIGEKIALIKNILDREKIEFALYLVFHFYRERYIPDLVKKKR